MFFLLFRVMVEAVGAVSCDDGESNVALSSRPYKRFLFARQSKSITLKPDSLNLFSPPPQAAVSPEVSSYPRTYEYSEFLENNQRPSPRCHQGSSRLPSPAYERKTDRHRPHSRQWLGKSSRPPWGDGCRNPLLDTNLTRLVSSVISRQKFIELGGFAPFFGGEDYNLWARLSLVGTIGYQNVPLVDRRIHGENTSIAWSSQRRKSARTVRKNTKKQAQRLDMKDVLAWSQISSVISAAHQTPNSRFGDI